MSRFYSLYIILRLYMTFTAFAFATGNCVKKKKEASSKKWISQMKYNKDGPHLGNHPTSSANFSFKTLN